MLVSCDAIMYNISMIRHLNKGVLVKKSLAFVVFLVSMSVLVTSSVFAVTYQSLEEVKFTFDPAITVSLSGDLLINNLSPSSASDSNIIDVTVATNASHGYNLLATVGQKNGTDSLVNTSNNTYTFTNLSTTAGSAATLNNFTDNKWGYSYSVDNGTNWISGNTGSTASGYAGLPLDNNDNADERGNGGVTLISTVNPADGKTIKFKIGAKASNTQASGTYTNTINFYAVANPEPELEPVACEAGKICYNANSLDPVQGEMGKQTAGNNEEVMLWAPNFKRSGYGFAGWNTSYDYTGTSYGPQQTITTPSNTSTNGLSLYAIWVKSAGNMQNWGGCNGLAIGAITALKDSRDNDVYAVARLADGKCWMIENLRLDSTPELSPTNTNNPSLPLTNNTGSTSNYLSATVDPTQTAWCTASSSACVNQSMLATNNTVFFTNNTSSNYSATSNVYGYGNYYNWYSATAGYGKYNTYNTGGNTPGDICPTGWHLPKGGNKNIESNNEIWPLFVTGINGGVKPANYDNSVNPYYTGNLEGVNMSKAVRSYPNNFVYSGLLSGSSIGNRNSYGYYWGATGSDYIRAYGIQLGNNEVYPATDGSNKYIGFSARCVAGT